MIRNLILVFFILASCAPNPPRWVQNLEIPSKMEGFILAGVYSMNDNIYAQYCDNAGNKLWMKYSEESKIWESSKYETGGCEE